MTGPTPGPTPQRGGPTQNLNTGQPLRGNATGGQSGGQTGGPQRAGFTFNRQTGQQIGTYLGSQAVFTGQKLKAGAQGVTRRAPKPQVQIWSPAPSGVLFLGVTLIGANLVVKGGFGPFLDTIWNLQDSGKHSKKYDFATATGVFGQIIFIFVLYVLATFSDTLARAMTVFLFGLWFIFLLFYGPKVVSLFK